MVLVGLGLIQQDMESHSEKGEESESTEDGDGNENVESTVEKVSKALAPIILPMIESLGSLDSNEMESKTSSGEAT